MQCILLPHLQRSTGRVKKFNELKNFSLQSGVPYADNRWLYAVIYPVHAVICTLCADVVKPYLWKH